MGGGGGGGGWRLLLVVDSACGSDRGSFAHYPHHRPPVVLSIRRQVTDDGVMPALPGPPVFGCLWMDGSHRTSFSA